MKTAREAVCAASAFVVALHAGCGWYNSESCDAGVTSCDGDTVRVCRLDAEASSNSDEPVFHWETQTRCADDDQLGPLTCGVVRGEAACIPERSNGTSDAEPTAGASRPGGWLRVEVTRDAGTFWLSARDNVHLLGAPPAATSGVAAVVTHHEDAIIDAVLVPTIDETRPVSVWLRSDDATRITLVNEGGELLAVTQLEAKGSTAPSEVRPAMQALTTTFPPTLRVAEHSDAPTPEVLDLLAGIINRMPVAATAVLTNLDFRDSGRSEPRVSRERTVLSINTSPELLEEYRRDPSVLTLEVVRETGRALSEVIYAVADKPIGDLAPKPPSAFPPDIQKALSARFSPMLRPGESFEEIWAGLHQIAVDGQFGRGYVRTTLRTPPDDRQAVDEGFASAAGATSPLHDFVEYFARVHVPELWSFGPCADLRAQPLDQLAPQRIVPLSKLLVLRGLDLLSVEALAECAGDLRLSSHESNITLHKGNGDRIVLTEEIEGVRQPYFDEEVELSWSAKRSYLSASLNVAYRGFRPAVIRLSPVAGHEGKDGRAEDDYAASLAVTNPASAYTTSVAQGGLLVVSSVERDKLEAFALMVRLNKAVASAVSFPLISAQVERPAWYDALD